jgi:hypothetical protein
MPPNATMESLGFVEGMGTGGEGRGATGENGARLFFGKYRAVVVDNIDPEGRCRLLLNVVDVYGPNISTWAMPCLPYAGLQMGAYIVPPPKAGVWVEFEHGDPDYPVWTGCWFGLPDPPVAAKAVTPGAPVFMMTSLKQSAIALSDTPLVALGLKQGGVVLSAGPQCFIAIEPTGVTIVAPKVDITGMTTINKPNLIVSL